MKKITHILFTWVLALSLVEGLFSCGGGSDSDSPESICDAGYEYIDGACNITGSLTDTDADGISDANDNCPLNWNPSQSTSGDTDSIADACDNCMYADNDDQSDMDGDGIGNACETDTDGDGVDDGTDNCDITVNSDQTNADGDACGAACDDNDNNASVCNDADGDDIDDSIDNCPTTSNNDQCDTNHNGVGNECDTEPLSACSADLTDDDGDGICNDFDNCDTVANPCQKEEEACDGTADADGDGYTSDVDCNDGNASIYPGATEACDGVDTDCDGYLDNGFETKDYYPDVDGDGYGNQAGPVTTSCKEPTYCKTSTSGATRTVTVGNHSFNLPVMLMASCVEDHTDCNDSDPDINPGVNEVADNGKDDNCDGVSQESEEASTREANTASAFWHGGSFKHEDGDNQEMERMSFYVGNVTLDNSADLDGDGDNDVKLSYVVGSQLIW